MSASLEGVRGRSGLDLGVYGLVAALIVASLVGPPLMGALDPRLAVTVAYHVDRAPKDLWGTPWVLVNGRPWSLGPDRLADEGRGDDVPVLDERDGWLQLYRGGGEALFGVAVLLAVLWELGRALASRLRAPRGPLAREAGQAALLAVPVAGLVIPILGFGSRLLPGGAAAVVEELRRRMLVPIELAVFGTVYAATAAVLLGVRLRAPASAGDDGGDLDATPGQDALETGCKDDG